jgi:CheY-like chemotaxis protein
MTTSVNVPVLEAPRVGGVLVVSESATDAVLIKTLLTEDFDNVLVRICPDAKMEAAEFLEWQPKVLLMAFREVSKAEQCYLGLFRTHTAGVLQPHRAILMCSKEGVKQAFEVCRRGLFDDYVLFWPMTYDAPRLRMTVHRAHADLAAHPENAVAALTIAAQARRILELEEILSQQREPGPKHIEGDGHSPSPDALDTVATAVSQRNNEMAETPFQNVRDSLHPLRQGAGEPQETASAFRESGGPFEVMRVRPRPVVLVVDDDEFQQRLLSLMLEPEGYQVRFASSGMDALHELHRATVDIILLDFKLPDVTGIEVTRRLKGEPRLAGIPVIMITGNSDRDVVLESRRIGVADFIVKPIERNVVLDKLRRLCSASQPMVANLP